MIQHIKHQIKICLRLSSITYQTQETFFEMKKGKNFGFKMQVFPHSYCSSTSSTPPKTPKNQHKTHQNLEREHFYETSKSVHGEKRKWRMRGKK